MTLVDHQAVVGDILRPPRGRELGPALRREHAGETAAQGRQLLDAATVHEPGDGETGETEGRGGTGPTR